MGIFYAQIQKVNSPIAKARAYKSSNERGIFMNFKIKKYIKTADMALKEKTNGGLFYLFPNILIQIFYLIPLLFLWRVVMNKGIDVGMNIDQMLTYTYISSLFSEQLVVKTVASGWLSEGILSKLYSRPISVFGQIIAQTIGSWIPMLLAFSLPMAIMAPIFKINIIPHSPWFFISMILCISLGFSIDFLFASLTIRLRGMTWISNVIRMAIVSFFSGTVIPFKLMPFGLSHILTYQPFGSLGGAPLSIFTGTARPFDIIFIQVLWNMILWPLAILIFKKSQEIMVSFGG